MAQRSCQVDERHCAPRRRGSSGNVADADGGAPSDSPAGIPTTKRRREAKRGLGEAAKQGEPSRGPGPLGCLLALLAWRSGTARPGAQPLDILVSLSPRCAAPEPGRGEPGRLQPPSALSPTDVDGSLDPNLNRGAGEPRRWWPARGATAHGGNARGATATPGTTTATYLVRLPNGEHARDARRERSRH